MSKWRKKFESRRAANLLELYPPTEDDDDEESGETEQG